MDQPTLEGIPGPRPSRRRTRDVGPAEQDPVAQVVVDRPGTLLDRTFDYAVPATLDTGVSPGVRVRVRLNGQDVDGLVVSRSAGSTHEGELAPLRRLVSPEVVLTPAVLALCRAVADRWAGSLADVLRLAVPPRHARTEAEAWPEPGDGLPAEGEPDEPAPAEPEAGASRTWSAMPGGPAFLRRVAEGGSPAAVWSAAPGPPGEGWADVVAGAVRAARAGGRGALVVVPATADVEPVTAALVRAGVPGWQPGSGAGWVRLVAEDGPAARYRAFLAAARGHADVVVGTRGAAFAPVADLGLVVCWDEGDGLHAEQRSPYPHAREVLAMRGTLEGAAVLLGGFGRSVAAQRRLEDGTARELALPREVLRTRTPRVRVLDRTELASEGPAAAARLPAPAWRAVRDTLRTAPVLVQVPRAGYVPVVACDSCRTLARCADCHGPLALGAAGAPPGCRWCGRLATAWRCPACTGGRLRSVRVGSERTAEELGRAFPGTTVRSSGAAVGVLRDVVGGPSLVVATPGAEPTVEGGYGLAVVLDTHVSTAAGGLDALTRATRTWLGAAALVRAADRGGQVLLVGDGDPAATQAVVRWDPGGLAGRELAERRRLDLPPAVHVLTVDGPRHAVTDVLGRAALPPATRVLGPLPSAGPGGWPGGAPGGAQGQRTAGGPGSRATTPDAVLLHLPGEEDVRALVRSPWPLARTVTRELSAQVASRAARRAPGTVRLRAEPDEV